PDAQIAEDPFICTEHLRSGTEAWLVALAGPTGMCKRHPRRVEGRRDVNSPATHPGGDQGARVLTKCSQVPVAGLADKGYCRPGGVGAVTQQAQLCYASR